MLYQDILIPVRSRGKGLKEIREDYIRITFFASKWYSSLYWLWIYCLEYMWSPEMEGIRQGLIQKFTKPIGLWLYSILSVLPSSVFFLCPQASLFHSNKKAARFLFHIMEREKISSYNHGKHLNYVLKSNGFCTYPLTSLWPAWGGTGPTQQSCCYTKRVRLDV